MGVLASALIWAFWHTPFALSGIHHFDNIPVLAVVVLMPPGHIGAGIFLGWLWLQTRSIWMLALAHGVLNNWGQYAFKFMDGPPEGTPPPHVPPPGADQRQGVGLNALRSAVGVPWWRRRQGQRRPPTAASGEGLFGVGADHGPTGHDVGPGSDRLTD